MLQFGLRLGERPRQVVTTTPRPIALLKRLMADPRTAVTHGGTTTNAYNLAPAFVETVLARYKDIRGIEKWRGSRQFFQYAVRGFVDQLRQQLRVVKYQQWELAWESYGYEKFGEKRTSTTRRQLALIMALSEKNKPVARSELRRINPKVAELYAGKTSKTLSRDLNALRKRKLISVLPEGIRPNKEIILAFLPDARAGGIEAQLKESAALIDEAGQLIFGF